MTALDVRARIFICFSLIIIGVSTPPQSLAAFGAYFACVALGVAAWRVPVLLFVKRASLAAPFVLMVAGFLPFLHRAPGDTLFPLLGGALHVSDSGLWMLANTALKGFLGVSCLVLLGAGVRTADFLAGLRWFRMPRVLVEMAGVTLRYLGVMRDEFLRMARARDARGWQGRWLWQARVVGQMIGALFLRSAERAERIYAAMVSRGYDGAIPQTPLPQARAADAAAAVAALAAFLGVRLFLA